MSLYLPHAEREDRSHWKSDLLYEPDPEALAQHAQAYEFIGTPDPETAEAEIIEAELIERKLARERLKYFVSRFTPDFIPGWHIDEITASCERLCQKVQRKHGTDARTIFEAPPRHAKSQCVSRCFPLWLLGHFPQWEIIVATYGQDLADDIGRWAKACLKDPAFQAVFPGLKLRKDSQAANRLDTTRGGGIRYVGVGAALTGRGGHVIIADDLVKDAEAADSEAISEATWKWYTSVLRTRLAPGGAIALMHTRWRLNDPIGRILKLQEEGGERYQRLTFPAMNEDDVTNEWGMKPGEPLHPARFSREDLLATKSALPPRDWRSLYMQKPMADEGNVFKTDEFDLYPAHEIPKKGIYWAVACDLAYSQASSADYSAIWPFGITHDDLLYFHPDFTRARLTTDQSIERILDYAHELNAQCIVIEGGQAWRAIEPEFMRRMMKRGKPFTIKNPQPTKDKYTRSRALHARMQAGMARWPETMKFKHSALPEFLMFTGKNDEHDDLVDACAWAGTIVQELVRPYSEDTDWAPEEDDEDVVAWSMADIERRDLLAKPVAQRAHSPPTLRGEVRRSGKEFSPYAK